MFRGNGTCATAWTATSAMSASRGNGSLISVVPAASSACTWNARGPKWSSYDLSGNHPWDIVPFAKTDYRQLIEERKNDIRKLNNSYWLNHRASAQARVVYGTIYAMPSQIGSGDISVFGNILLHLRDPFLVLYNALRLTRSTVVTDVLSRRDYYQSLFGLLRRPSQRFMPDFRSGKPDDCFWIPTPEAIIQSWAYWASRRRY